MLTRILLTLTCVIFSVTASAADPIRIEKFDKLDEDFWAIALPASDAGASLNKFDDIPELELKGGAALKSRDSFKENLDLEFRWAYEPGEEDADGTEILRVGVRVGKQRLMNSVVLEINAKSGKVSLLEIVDGKVKELKSKSVRIDKDETKPAIPRGDGQNWFRFRMRDDGKKISVVCTELDDLALEAEYDPAHHTENRILFLNSAQNRSFLRELIIRENK